MIYRVATCPESTNDHLTKTAAKFKFGGRKLNSE